MPTGKVKWFSTAKGFGFIEGADGDVFVHYSVILPDAMGFRNLKEGETVEYECQRTVKGLQATAVRLLPTPKGAREG